MSPAVDPQDHVIGPGRTDGAEIYVSNGTDHSHAHTLIFQPSLSPFVRFSDLFPI